MGRDNTMTPPPKELPDRYMRLCVLYEDGAEWWADIPEEDAAEACRIHHDRLFHPGNVHAVASGRFHCVDLNEAKNVWAVPIPKPPPPYFDDDDDDCDVEPIDEFDPDPACPACCC